MTQAYRPENATAIDAQAARNPITATFVRCVRELSALDYVLLTYFALLFFALAVGSGPDRGACAETVATDATFFIAGILLTRGGVLRYGGGANAFIYRMTIFLPFFLSYFQLREILPAVSARAVDADIYAFDLRLFGVEPSVAWDKFVTPGTTEWFSFFYFGYFFILSAHVLPMMFNGRNVERLAHFALGIFFLFCCAHLVYMLVPGYGPYSYLAGTFKNELRGGLFWGLVKTTVDAGGAQKDIFPSLHTAVPTYFAIFSYRHRKAFPFKYTWPIMVFASTQVICATMFLRWHYLIDIFAGITLATTSALAAQKVVAWEMKRRAARGRQPLFALFSWSKPESTEGPTEGL